MQPVRRDLEELGATIARHSDTSPKTDEVLHNARQRLRQSALDRRFGRAGPARPRSHRRALAAAALCAALALGFFGVPELRPHLFGEEVLSFQVETARSPAAGRWVSAEQETKQLKFSDGTSLALHHGTKLKVERTTPRGARILLGEGRAHARVQHGQNADWRFDAGPFSVRVTGTEFELAWDPAAQVFELAMHEGSVELRGPRLGAGRVLEKGAYLKLELSQAQDSPQDAPGTPDQAAPPAASPPEAGTAQAVPGGDSEPPAAPPPSPAAAPRASWQDLLKRQDRRAALAVVRQTGVPLATQGASPAELWSLSEAARLGGAPALAREVLLVLRRTHGARGDSAYALGKIAADQLGDQEEAIKWFETYLQEAPDGGLRETALGRLVELKAGTAQGREAARRYLEAYPRGSYAAFARSSLR